LNVARGQIAGLGGASRIDLDHPSAESCLSLKLDEGRASSLFTV
jgi:hypothetical protein